MSHLRFRRVRQCIFCENKANSREHAWPDWVLQRFRTPDNKIFGHVDGKPHYDPNQKQLRVRCVCDDCNNGWMSQLEQRIIPTAACLMEGLTIPLDRTQQEDLSAWALKTAMVSEYISTEKPLFWSDRERVQMRESQLVPPRTSVWLGRYDGRATFFAIGNDGEGQDPEGPSLTAYVTTMIFGVLAIQIAAVKLKSGETRDAEITAKRGPWGGTTIQVYPTKPSVEWPPPAAIVDSGSPGFTLKEFHHRWGTLLDPSVSWIV